MASKVIMELHERRVVYVDGFGLPRVVVEIKDGSDALGNSRWKPIIWDSDKSNWGGTNTPEEVILDLIHTFYLQHPQKKDDTNEPPTVTTITGTATTGAFNR